MITTESMPLSQRSLARSPGDRSPLHRRAHVPAARRRDVMAHSGPPQVPSFAIRRTRLERHLDDHSDRRVVLVRGPAGAGKTVLVAQWVRTDDDPCAWLTIDTTDNHGRVLVRHIAEAVGQLVPDMPVVGWPISSTSPSTPHRSAAVRRATALQLV